MQLVISESNNMHFIIDWNSALFIILNGTKEEHLDMLDGGIIQRLLEEKWKTFARVKHFITSMFSQLIFCNSSESISKEIADIVCSPAVFISGGVS